MTRRSKVWLVVAVLFTFVNFGGGVFAAAQGDLLHALTHAGLLVLGVFWARHLWRKGGGSAIPDEFGEFTNRLTHVEQSVDAVAIELERIGEGQRFITRLFTEKSTQQAPGEGDPEPIEIKTR